MASLVAGAVETNLIKRCVVPSKIIFDVGAHKGLWTQIALKKEPFQVHLFEPLPEYSALLQKEFAEHILKKQCFVNNYALSNKEGLDSFFFYPDHPTLSSIYRREIGEKVHKLGTPISLGNVVVSTLDIYCAANSIESINYLKIDVEGAELDVVLGAERLLSQNSIDFIEFEYGGTYLDSGKTLQQVYAFLRSKGYKIFKATSSVCSEITIWDDKHEDYQYAIYIATLPIFSSLLERK